MNKDFIQNTILTKQQTALFYLGQEGYLIKHQDKYILIDPYLSDYVDQNCCTDCVHWERNYPAPISAKELDFIDYVLCTHAHYDHADPWTLAELAKTNPNATFIVPKPITDTILSYGIHQNNLIGAVADELLELDGCNILPVPAAHEELHPDENGYFAELGYKVLLDDLSIFHAGDCCVYDGLKERLMHVDVLMVPVNGRSFVKRYVQDIIGNMTCEEAVVLATETNAGMIIPMHYDLYPCNSINPAHFVDTLYSMNPFLKFHMFVPGERYLIQK